MLTEIFAFASFVLFACGSLPYVLSVMRGDTNPQRSSVLIFLLVGALNLFSQFAEGAILSLVFPIVTMSMNVCILIFMKKSEIGSIKLVDKISLIASIIIALLWALTGSAALAIALLVGVNIIAKILIARKVYEYPESEPLRSYLFWIAGSVFTMLSVGSLDYILMLPAFNNIVTLAVIAVIMFTRKQKLALYVDEC